MVCLFLSFHCYILLPRTRKYCKNKEDRIDSCGGDSGGSWLFKPKWGRCIIWGIPSFVKGCGRNAIMAFMPKCRITSAGFEVPYQSSETTPQKMPQLTCILSIPVIIHIFLKKDNYFQILFIMNLSNKLSQNKLFLMMEWCVYFFIFTAIFHCLELDIKENQIDSSKKYTNQRL